MAAALPSWSALVRERRLAHTAILTIDVGIRVVDAFILAAILPSVERLAIARLVTALSVKTTYSATSKSAELLTLARPAEVGLPVDHLVRMP